MTRSRRLDRDLGQRLETIAGASTWLKGVPAAMLMLFGVGALIAFIINPPPLHEPGREYVRTIVLFVGLGCVLVGGLAFWYFAVAGKRAGFDALADGFTCVVAGKDYAVNWTDIAYFSVHHAEDDTYHAFLAFIIRVDLDDGTKLCFSKDDFGVPGVYKILDHIHRGIGPLRAETLRPRLAKSETLALDPFTVNRSGFTWRRESIAWSELDSITTWENLITFHLKGGHKIATKINYLDCPNYCAFLALADLYGRLQSRT